MTTSGEPVALAYDDVGTGAGALVFLHGFPLDRTLWTPQLHGFRDATRCIAPDLRGLGDSPGAPPYSMDAYADDVAALLDRLGVTRATVVGLSMGGYVAFALWRRHPARVRALVLANTRAGADGAEARARRQTLVALARIEGSRAVADAQLPGLLGRSTRRKHPELVDAVGHMMAAAPVPGVIGALEAMLARPDSGPTLATITVPTLVVVGDEDVVTPVAEAERLHAGIAGSRLQVIAGAGHLSNLERPSAFNHALCDFVSTLPDS